MRKMEILETNKTPEKTFADSQVNMQNRRVLSITGVEKVYETSTRSVQLKVAGSNMCISGESLNISKLDVETGNIQIEGLVNEIKYSSSQNKESFLKKIFR